MSNDLCHCGEPAVADCPCCVSRVCVTHLVMAANALASAVGLKGTVVALHHENCPRTVSPNESLTMIGCDGCYPNT